MYDKTPESLMKWPLSAFKRRERKANADPLIGYFGPVLRMHSESRGDEIGVVISNYRDIVLMWFADRKQFDVCQVSKYPFPEDPPDNPFS